jgi:hypothetical protein
VGSRPPCTTDGTPCGGRCDGTSATACAYPAGTTPCRSASCANDLETLAATCTGTGQCPTMVQSTCGRYVCGTAACKTSCTSDADCSTGNLCHTAACQSALTVTVTITGDHGTIACPTSVAPGASPICTVKPAPGYTLDTLTDEAAGSPPVDVFALVNPNMASDPNDDTYTIGNMQTDHRLAASFKRQLGAVCTSASECHSGICADQVCCNAACTGQCQACDVQGSAGTCMAVTGAPHGARPACTGSGTTCGGSCDGLVLDKCTYANDKTSCRAPSCTSGVAVPESFCDGHGACPEEAPVTCGGSACAGTGCGTDCGSSEPCPSSEYCSAGLCLPQKPNGAACTHGTQCTSGLCVDHVCCDAACEGSCEACAESGNLGTCIAVTGVPRGPRVACATDGSACGGTCNGITRAACVYPSSATECRAQSCTDGVVTQSAPCDGAGTCGAMHTTSCGHYTCTATGCKTACATSADCTASNGCLGGLCQPAFRVTVIVDGHGSVACQDPVPVGSAALCRIVPEPGYALTALTDAGAGQTAVDVLGLVDSKGTADPSDDTYTTAILDADRVIHATFRLGAGVACAAAGDCLTGFCVDGVCCNTACTGQCEACSLPASLGVCAAVGGQPVGQRTPCVGDGTVCSGVCDGTNRAACTYPGTGALCRPPSCANGVAILGASCQGNGACPPPQPQSCGEYACGPEICLGNCTGDVDCLAGEHCSAGICVANAPVGAACASAAQCASGLCVDGVCCQEACAGQCQACNLSGSAGACATVSNAVPRGGRPPCAGSGLCQGLCDGSSATSCAMPGPTVACGQAGCVNGAGTTQGACDGLGACAGGQTRSCGLFQCDPAGCKTTCQSDLDCVAGAQCAAGTCALSSPLDAALPAPALDASFDDAISASDGPGAHGFHVMGGGCRCNLGRATGTNRAALLLAWLAVVCLLGRRRPRS